LDVVVAVHHASAQCLDPLADRLGRRPFTVACLTDYSIHANWIADADLYLVASDTAYERLTRLGKRVEKLQILPCQAPDKVRLKTIDEEYGTIKIVMMMGLEGTSRRKAQRLIGKLLELPVGKRVQIDVICGRNQRLQERFENDYQECPEVTIHGYVDDVPERLKRANLALMRLGCVSMTEALAAGTPVIGFDWHAHEAECLEKLHEIGAGTGSLNPAEAASLVEGFLRNASLRRRWYTQAFKASQSESSSAAAARLILENLRRPASDRSSTSDRSSGVS
ncbi:MAG: glycosyltransferase, partial [Planctomycetota bacterium]